MTDQYFNAPLAEVDPEIAQVLERELERQRGYLEMIASENFVPVSVLQSQGSVLTNKYAEGYPGRRYYGGCEEVDVAEELAIERAKSLFGADVRERPAALRCDRERRRAARDRPPRRHAARPLARPGRPPHARHEDQLLGPALQHRRVRRRPRDVDHRHGRGAPPRDRAPAEGHHRRLVGVPAPARLRGASARSPTRSARCCGSTWRTSPASSPRACTRTRCRTRTSSPRPCTRRSAARARASSSRTTPTSRRRSTPRSSPASRAARSCT